MSDETGPSGPTYLGVLGALIVFALGLGAVSVYQLLTG